MQFESQMVVDLARYASAGMAMGFGAIGAAVGEGYCAGAANQASSSRPELSGDIIKNMLIGQAIAESAGIFALVVAVLLLFLGFSGSATSAMALVGAGLSMGLGAIGSGVGSGFPAAEACKGLARQPAAKNSLTTNMLIGSAVCQTPAIFSLVVAFILMFLDFSARPFNPNALALLGAGFAMGFGSIGSGLGGGLAAGGSAEAIARQPHSVGPVTGNMLVGQAVSQTPAIFGLLIAFILIFSNYPEAPSILTATALLSAGLCMGLGGVGPGIGNGIVAQEAIRWIGRREEAINALTRTMLVAQAVSQSTAIYAMVIALVLIFVI
jgi:F0F1-type ATP synthase membrane subunit c/vacuolar-type H+-ATPase subunit K